MQREIVDRYQPKDYQKRGAIPTSYETFVADFANKLKKIDNPVVLDVGAGSCSAQPVFENFGVKLISVDVFKEGLNLGGGMRVQALAETLPIQENSVAGIHMKDAIVHCPDRKKLFAALNRVLVPEGLVFIITNETKGQYFNVNYGLLGGKMSINFDSFEEYQKKVKKIKDKDYGAVGPPYFLTTKESLIKDAKEQGFKKTAEKTWSPEKDEVDWFEEKKPPSRIVLEFEKY